MNNTLINLFVHFFLEFLTTFDHHLTTIIDNKKLTKLICTYSQYIKLRRFCLKSESKKLTRHLVVN